MKIKSTINLPEVLAVKTVEGIMRHLAALKKAIVDRDRKIAAAVNQYDVEVATVAPVDPPQYPAPAFRLVNTAGAWTLWVYTGDTDGWKSVNLA